MLGQVYASVWVNLSIKTEGGKLVQFDLRTTVIWQYIFKYIPAIAPCKILGSHFLPQTDPTFTLRYTALLVLEC